MNKYEKGQYRLAVHQLFPLQCYQGAEEVPDMTNTSKVTYITLVFENMGSFVIRVP